VKWSYLPDFYEEDAKSSTVVNGARRTAAPKKVAPVRPATGVTRTRKTAPTRTRKASQS
jgi:hypothetical protein